MLLQMKLKKHIEKKQKNFIQMLTQEMTKRQQKKNLKKQAKHIVYFQMKAKKLNMIDLAMDLKMLALAEQVHPDLTFQDFHLEVWDLILT